MIEYFHKHKHVFFTFLVLVFIFYGNSLKNKYALDDDYITVTNFPDKGKKFTPNNNLVSKGVKGISKIWKSRYAHDGEGAFDYRPVTTTTFAIEYALFGQNPFVSHLINILLYFITIWLMFCCLLKLFENYEYNHFLAFLTSLIFLIHPIHTEVVNNLKCRDELLAFLFSLCALWFSFHLYKKTSLKTILLIILFLLLGLFSKKTTVLFIGIIPMCLLFFREINYRKASFIIIAFIVVGCIVPLIKGNIIDEKIVRHFYHFENPLYTDDVSVFHRLLIGIKTFGFYVKFLLFPFPFRNYYGANAFDLTTNLNSYFFIGLGFIILSFFLILKTKNKLLFFSILLFCISIAPFTNVGTPAPGVIAERFAYFSSMGFSLIITVLITNYSTAYINYKSVNQFFLKPLVYLVPVMIISMIYVWNRNSNWYNKVVLFEHDIPYLTNSAKANSLIANEYFEMMQSPNKKYSQQIIIQKALKHYSLAVTNDSSLYSAYNNAGVVYYSFLSDIPKAKSLFKLATIHKEEYAQAYENLGNCYKIEKDTNQAFQSYKMAIIYGKQKFSSYLALINMLFEFKQYQKALNIIKIANSHFPNNYDLTAQEANCYFMKGDTATALNIYEEAYKLNSNHELAQFISQKYKAFRNIEKSEFYGSK